MVIIVKKYPRGSQKKPLVIVIGKSVAKKAVDRNTVKRRIRAIMVSFLERARYDYVIICRTGVAALSFKKLRDEIIEKTGVSI